MGLHIFQWLTSYRKREFLGRPYGAERQGGKIQAGHGYRDWHILFAAREAKAIRQFAHRVESIDPPEGINLTSFAGSTRSDDRCMEPHNTVPAEQ